MYFLSNPIGHEPVVHAWVHKCPYCIRSAYCIILDRLRVETYFIFELLTEDFKSHIRIGIILEFNSNRKMLGTLVFARTMKNYSVPNSPVGSNSKNKFAYNEYFTNLLLHK